MDIYFSRMLVGNLHTLTFHYKNGFSPLNPQRGDIMRMMGGSYAQEHVLVSVAKIIREISADVLEVQLESPAFFSYRSGPTVTSDRYALHRDGHVMCFANGASQPTEWGSNKPRWEFTKFPVLPVIVSGCDFPAPFQHDSSPPVRRADGPPAGQRGAKRSKC
jgi:hypothetical protein